MLAADKPPDKTKDKQDSGGPACRHVPVRDSAVSFRGQKGNRDRRDQQPVEKPERGIPNPETITVARFCHEHHLSPWPLAIREIADGALTNAGQRSRQTAAPNRLPTPAVNAIARAPQNVTRTHDRMTGAPPAFAPSAPRDRKNRRRSAERRFGKEGVIACIHRGLRHNSKKTNTQP